MGGRYWTPYDDTSVTVVLRIPVQDDTPITGCWPSGGGEKTSGCVDISYKVLIDRSDLDNRYTGI